MIKETFEVLRNKFYKKGDYPEKIYISRRDTKNRQLLNEAEVEDFLRQRGFVPIMLTGLSLAEQINLFAHAKAVIAPHGAGLANVAFCEPETKILEIHMPSYLNWCYRRLSAVLNLRYGFLFGDLMGEVQENIHARSFLLNLNSFEQCFDEGFSS
jgi:capsular polysaccharide biosynthesis protein